MKTSMLAEHSSHHLFCLLLLPKYLSCPLTFLL